MQSGSCSRPSTIGLLKTCRSIQIIVLRGCSCFRVVYFQRGRPINYSGVTTRNIVQSNSQLRAFTDFFPNFTTFVANHGCLTIWLVGYLIYRHLQQSKSSSLKSFWTFHSSSLTSYRRRGGCLVGFCNFRQIKSAVAVCGHGYKELACGR